jgi:hypothetical protein
MSGTISAASHISCGLSLESMRFESITWQNFKLFLEIFLHVLFSILILECYKCESSFDKQSDVAKIRGRGLTQEYFLHIIVASRGVYCHLVGQVCGWMRRSTNCPVTEAWELFYVLW